MSVHFCYMGDDDVEIFSIPTTDARLSNCVIDISASHFDWIVIYQSEILMQLLLTSRELCEHLICTQ